MLKLHHGLGPCLCAVKQQLSGQACQQMPSMSASMPANALYFSPETCATPGALPLQQCQRQCTRRCCRVHVPVLRWHSVQRDVAGTSAMLALGAELCCMYQRYVGTGCQVVLHVPALCWLRCRVVLPAPTPLLGVRCRWLLESAFNRHLQQMHTLSIQASLAET